LFAEPAAELRDVRDGRSIQRPQHVLVEGFDPLGQRDLDAIGEQSYCRNRFRS
jgi:hypothetical protein